MKDWFDSSHFFSGAPKTTSSTQPRKRKLETTTNSSFKKPTELLTSKDELWSDVYTPSCSEDLSVNQKKVGAVRDWLLENVVSTSKQTASLLLLSGPSGSGKTAVLKTLASELDISLTEWLNPVEQIEFSDMNKNIVDNAFDAPEDRLTYISQKQLFKDWLRGCRYSTLEDCDKTDRSKMLLIEEFPTLAVTNPSEFQEMIRSYSKSRSNPPLVLICSEENGSRSSFLKTIFKSEFLLSTGIENISFNSATTTNIVKLLTKIVSEVQKSRKISSSKLPDKSALESLSESTGGDIRAAINSLQFSCLTSSSSCAVSSSDYSAMFQTTSSSQKSSKSKSRKSTKSKTVSAQSTIGLKDRTLDMFHGLGKILYAKRQPGMEEGWLPPHLEDRRRKVLEANPDEVFELTELNEEAFTCFLHHNYPLFYSDIGQTSDMLEYMSEADTMLKDWGTTGKMNVKEYGVSMVSRAVMFYNQCPVASQGMRKLTRPEYYDVKKKIDGNNDRLERAVHKLSCLYPKKEFVTVMLPSVSQLTRKPVGYREVIDLATFPICKTSSQEPKTVRTDDEFFSEDDEFFEEFVNEMDIEGCEVVPKMDDKGRELGDEDLQIEEYESD